MLRTVFLDAEMGSGGNQRPFLRPGPHFSKGRRRSLSGHFIWNLWTRTSVRGPLTVAVEVSGPRADFNGDGQVSFADFLLFAGAFGSQSGDPAYSEPLDLNANGSIDFPDFIMFAEDFE